MKDTISYEELMTELEKHRGPRSRERILTEQQKNFLIKCRAHSIPVTYDMMAVLWQRRGWGKVASTTIRTYWLQLKKDNA